MALKFSSAQFTDRFTREARSIAALNHPNICTLYDIGPDYLVMELIEGRTLDQSIPNPGLRIAEALRYAVEYSRPLSGGAESRILSGVLACHVANDGLYIVRPSQSGATLHFTDLQGGHERRIADLPSYWMAANHLEVSPDRKRILYSAWPARNTVIQMIDGFR